MIGCQIIKRGVQRQVALPVTRTQVSSETDFECNQAVSVGPCMVAIAAAIAAADRLEGGVQTAYSHSEVF